MWVKPMRQKKIGTHVPVFSCLKGITDNIQTGYKLDPTTIPLMG